MKVTLKLPDATYALSVVIVWDKDKAPLSMNLSMSGIQASGSELYNGQTIEIPMPEEATT